MVIMWRLNTKVFITMALASLVILTFFELRHSHGRWYRMWRPIKGAQHATAVFCTGANLEAGDGSAIPAVVDQTAAYTNYEAKYHDGLNATLMRKAKEYVQVILNPADEQFPRMRCPNDLGTRYQSLSKPDGKQRTYLFAIDLHQNANILPRLLGSVLEAMHILGEQNCALSIVEGRSDDGTLEVLVELESALRDRNIQYFLQTSDIDPFSAERIRSLAELRNMALQPYTSSARSFAKDATIVFINDIVLCPEDILEIIYQRDLQKADMTCGMDWTYVGEHPTFYDVWIARSMTGDTFFNIPEDGSWDNAWNLFWDHAESQTRYHQGQSFQVFSCWNGITAFTAKPLLEKQIEFRERRSNECLQGEPKLFCKDFWLHGYGKIAVVSSVNVEYSDEAGTKVKEAKGYVSKWLENEDKNYRIQWQKDPPEKVKCMPNYDQQMFKPWDEGT